MGQKAVSSVKLGNLALVPIAMLNFVGPKTHRYSAFTFTDKNTIETRHR